MDCHSYRNGRRAALKQHQRGRRSGDFNRPFYQYQIFGRLFRKETQQINLRPGALSPVELKSAIGSVELGSVVELVRIGFDGQIDDVPFIIELTEVNGEGFAGKIVNVEREIIEGNSEKLVYARQGGGIVEFRYTDGDIKEVIENTDADMIRQSRDISYLLEVVSALDIDDRVLVSYFDKKHRGTVNVEGILQAKTDDHKNFRVVIDKINNIKLDNIVTKQFNIERDLVIDVTLH